MVSARVVEDDFGMPMVDIDEIVDQYNLTKVNALNFAEAEVRIFTTRVTWTCHFTTSVTPFQPPKMQQKFSL